MKKRRRDASEIVLPVSRADVDCVVCGEVMHDPCCLRCECKQSFCRKCVSKWLEKHHQCPHCKQNLIDKTIESCSRQWKNILDSVRRPCPNNSACGFKRGGYEEMSRHATEECIFRQAKCPNNDCAQIVLFKNMKEHARLCRSKRCKNFIAPKYGCQEMGTQKEIDQHEGRCAVPLEILSQIRKLLEKKGIATMI
jgi:hypothetical protein